MSILLLRLWVILVDTPSGSVSAKDFEIWSSTLRSGDSLSFGDQLKLQNFCIVLRDEYLKLNAAYKSCSVRLELVESPLNMVANLVADYRSGMPLAVEGICFLIESLMNDFALLNLEDAQ